MMVSLQTSEKKLIYILQSDHTLPSTVMTPVRAKNKPMFKRREIEQSFDLLLYHEAQPIV